MHIEDPAPLTRDHFGKNWVGIVSYYIFHWRNPLLAIGILVTVVLGWSATRLEVQAGFSKMLPLEHPYMQTFLKYQQDFGGANKVLVAVKAREGTIFSAEALAKLKAVHEDLAGLAYAAGLLVAVSALLAGWGVFVRQNRYAEELEPEAMQAAKREDHKLE